MSRTIEKWGDGYLSNGTPCSTYEGAMALARARIAIRETEAALATIRAEENAANAATRGVANPIG